jgi:hypothetical protein
MALQYNSSGDFIGLSGWQTPAPQRLATQQTAAPQMTPPMAANSSGLTPAPNSTWNMDPGFAKGPTNTYNDPNFDKRGWYDPNQQTFVNTPAPQMAANNSSDLARSIIGGTPPMPTPDPNMITGNNIPKAYGGGTPSYQGTNGVIPVPSAYPIYNATPQVSTEQAAARVAEQKARDDQTRWSNGMANSGMNQQFQPTPAPATAAPTQPPIPVRSDAEIAAYVKQQIDASLGITQSAADQAIAQGQTAANQQLGAIKTQYDQNQANVKENRTLENSTFNETNDPFSGLTKRNMSLRDFARERTDREASQGLATSQGNVNQNLTDLQNSINAKQKALVDASPAEAAKLNQSLQNDRNQLQLQLRTADRADLQLQQQAAQNDFTRQSDTFKNNLAASGQQLQQQQLNQAQSNADRNFNYNSSQDTITNNRNATNDAANFTGNYTSPQTQSILKQMAANSAAYATASPQEQARLHQANLDLGKQAGLTDTTGNGDYAGNTSTRTMAGQTLDLNNAKDMAVLTGKMPDGTPTNAAQQQQLQNQWIVAEQTGIIPDSLADFYGLPHGMQTQAAKNQAAQIAISSRNSANSERSTAASIANMGADNTRADNAVALSEKGRMAQGTIAGDLSKIPTNDPTAAQNAINAYFNANASHFVPDMGADAFEKMKQNALAPYTKVTPADKQDATSREKAIAAAQKDTRWDLKNTDRNALIAEYEKYYK